MIGLILGRKNLRKATQNMRFNSNFQNRIETFVSSVMITLLTLFPQFISGQEYGIESEMEKGVPCF